MGYPKKLLADDEHIVYELRPHWRALITPAFVFLLTLALGFYALAKWDSAPVRWIVAAVMGIALVVWVIRPFVFWWSTQYVFTDARIIVRTGVVARRGRDMPLSRVNDVSFEHSFLERFLNCGTLVVESAGTQGQLVIHGVPDVELIQREIYRLHDEDDARRRGEYGRPYAGGPPQPWPPQQQPWPQQQQQPWPPGQQPQQPWPPGQQPQQPWPPGQQPGPTSGGPGA